MICALDLAGALALLAQSFTLLAATLKHCSRGTLVLYPAFFTHSQLETTLTAAACENLTAISRLHACTEAVGTVTFDVGLTNMLFHRYT